MRGPRVLALLWLDGVADAALEETLRLLAALVAVGARVRILASSGDLARLAEEAPSAEASTLLEGLSGFGVLPERLEDARLDAALAAADHVVRLAPPDRAGAPLLLASRESGIEELRSAGQVLV